MGVFIFETSFTFSADLWICIPTDHLKQKGKCTCNAVDKYFRFNCVTFLNITVDDATELVGRHTDLQIRLWVTHIYTKWGGVRHKWSDHKRKLENETDKQTVPYLSQLVSGISPRIFGFDPRPVDTVVAMDNVAIKQGFLRGRKFSLFSSFQQCSVFIHHPRCIILATNNTVK
jgi:hypothetical protein